MDNLNYSKVQCPDNCCFNISNSIDRFFKQILKIIYISKKYILIASLLLEYRFSQFLQTAAL